MLSWKRPARKTADAGLLLNIWGLAQHLLPGYPAFFFDTDMSIDPLRFAFAAVPMAAYFLVIGLINLRRRPFMTTGSCDLAALGAALSGIVFVGPIELFRPSTAAAEMGNYAWLLMLAFYWLTVWLVVLLARPRIVIYNMSSDELHSALAETAAELDANARWAGDSLVLPGLGVQLHIESLEIMRNVSLVSSGPRQSLEGWRQLATLLSQKLASIRVQANPRAVSFFLAAFMLFTMLLMHLARNPSRLAEAILEVFQY